jgi:RNA polymerase sigma-70 factor (ECF subfamily)
MTAEGLAVQLGDPDFASWVGPHLPAMRRFATVLSSIDDAEDLVQDALTRAWFKWEQFNPDRGSSSGWLLAIVADRARSYWRRRTPDVRLDRHDLQIADADPVFLDLRKAVNSLPPRQRLAIALYHYVDLSVEDTATVMNCSIGTVKSTLSDARQALRARLGDSYDQD